MTEYIVAAVVGIIEIGFVVYKYYVNTLGRNPVCGGFLGFSPLCPLTGWYTQVYQEDGDSCLSPFACGPGLSCRTGRCQTASQSFPFGRRSVFVNPNEVDRAQWCTTDLDCEGFTVINPLLSRAQPTALCVSGRCRPAIVQYGTIPVLLTNVNINRTCNLISCPPGVCICIKRTDEMDNGYTELNTRYGTPRIINPPGGPSFRITHPPFGLSGRSIINSAIGFNSESLIPNPDRNSSKIARIFVICLVLVIISMLALAWSSTSTGKKRVFLLMLVIVLQVLFFVLLISRWS